MLGEHASWRRQQSCPESGMLCTIRPSRVLRVCSRAHFHSALLRILDPRISSGQPNESDAFLAHPRLSASNTASLTAPPTAATMLTREFIHDSLYNPSYGYFSKHATIVRDAVPVQFSTIRDSIHFSNLLAERYMAFDSETSSENAANSNSAGMARQIWHTPSELFHPWYGRALARYLAAEYKLHSFPQHDLIIYELGAGNGTFMLDVLDYLEQHEPSVYERTRYNVIEISARLAGRLENSLRHPNSKYRHHPIRVVNKSIFEWDKRVHGPCFVVAMEVIDNFAHDLIRYDLATGDPVQGVVAIGADKNFTAFYEPISDPLIQRYLSVRRRTSYRSPLLRHRGIQRRLANLPFAPNLTASEFLPTRSMQFMEILRDYFPAHRLILTDFDRLPDALPGICAPVVQTRYRGETVACETYMVMPGMFDIFFPTNFELLREVYQLVCRSEMPSERSNRVLTHRQFLDRYAELDQTRVQSGENVMLDYYENCKFLLT